MLDLKVYCINKSIGCEWRHELRGLQTHLADECVYVEQACRYRCGGRYQRRSLPEHELHKCSQRPVAVKLESAVVNMNERMTQLEDEVLLKQAELETQVNRFKRMMTEQQQMSDRRVNQLAEQIRTFECQMFLPPCTLTMPDYEYRKRNNKWWYSPPFFSTPGGYKMCLRVDPGGSSGGAGTHVSIFVHMMRGENDADLKWPFQGKVTIQLLNHGARTQDPWEWPVLFDHKAVDKGSGLRVLGQEQGGNGLEQGGGWGCPQFISQTAVENRTKAGQYIHNDCLTFRISRVIVDSLQRVV